MADQNRADDRDELMLITLGNIHQEMKWIREATETIAAKYGHIRRSGSLD